MCMEHSRLDTGAKDPFRLAAHALLKAKSAVAFTGAGISVESGIPPFRGPNGLWSTYDPICLDIEYFHANPDKSWVLIKEIFYDFFGAAQSNDAHKALAELEARGIIQTVITQNIDMLHQKAGSRNVYEFHGSSGTLSCSSCKHTRPAENTDLSILPPRCELCGGIMRPDFVFFGEPIPEPAASLSFDEARAADCFLIIGTTGEIMPASLIPRQAKQNGARIIEINPEPSLYTNEITDIFIKEEASAAMNRLMTYM